MYYNIILIILFKMSFIDQIISKLMSKRWKLDEKPTTFTYNIPKNQKIQLDENNNLILYRNPSHYVHYTAFQYNIGFTGFFCTFTLFQIYLSIKLYKKLKVKKILLFGLGFTVSGFYEAYLAYTRVKDPYEIVLKEGKRIIIKSYQDELPYEMDINDMRVISPADLGYYTILDSSNKNYFRLFYIEPNFGNVYNRQVFNYVFEDKRYLTYTV